MLALWPSEARSKLFDPKLVASCPPAMVLFLQDQPFLASTFPTPIKAKCGT